MLFISMNRADCPFSLAVDYLFLTTDGADVRKELVVESFNAVNEQNDYEVGRSRLLVRRSVSNTS